MISKALFQSIALSLAALTLVGCGSATQPNTAPLDLSTVVGLPSNPTQQQLDSQSGQRRLPVASLSNIRLDDTQHAWSLNFQTTAASDYRLDLDAIAPGTDWGRRGAESAVVSLSIDGQDDQDVVLWGGEQATHYGLSLGQLQPGKHQVMLRFAKDKSPAGAQGVVLQSAVASQVSYASPEAQWIADYAPILYGRSGLDNTHTDTPLAQYAKVVLSPDGSRQIDYGYVFSNEDGGDGAMPSLEQAHWGRLTDFETMFKVSLDPAGHVTHEQFEGRLHFWHDFKGEHRGTHPVVTTYTANNNVTDSGGGPLCFRLAMDHLVTLAMPREDFMRQNPRWFETEYKELKREGKINPDGNADIPNVSIPGRLINYFGRKFFNRDTQIADPRNYLYVELQTINTHDSPLWARVTTKDGLTRDSDMGDKSLAVVQEGWSQTTILLPAGTQPGDIARVDFMSEGPGRVVQVGHVYMLDQTFQPHEVRVPGTNPLMRD